VVGVVNGGVKLRRHDVVDKLDVDLNGTRVFLEAIVYLEDKVEGLEVVLDQRIDWSPLRVNEVELDVLKAYLLLQLSYVHGVELRWVEPYVSKALSTVDD
jgi:uncharacterized protein Smg (DUF494 family)